MTNGIGSTGSLRNGVAEEVRALLARKRMTGDKLAAAIDRSPMYVSRRLRGEVPFDLDDLERIAAALDVIVLRLLPREALQPQGSASEVTTRYRPAAERPTPEPSVRTAPARAAQPKRRPRAATSPGRATPKADTRRPAIVPRMVGA